MALDVEGYPTAPEQLELQQVHVYIRSGERTPTEPRMLNHFPYMWLQCPMADNPIRGVLLPTGDSESSFIHSTRRFNIVTFPDSGIVFGPLGTDPNRPIRNACYYGALTRLGLVSTSRYGHALRRLYIEKLDFLPDILPPLDTVYFRTTRAPRTMSTITNVVHALYPPPALRSSGSADGQVSFKIEGPNMVKNIDSSLIPVIHTKVSMSEDLRESWHCHRFRVLQDFWAKVACDGFNQSLAELDHKLSKFNGGTPVRLNSQPSSRRASGILDTVKSAKANGFPLPAEFEDPAVMNVLEKAVTAELLGGYRNRGIRRLGIGRAIEDLRSTMAKKVELGDQDPLKMRILATHDVTLSSLLISLNAFDGRLPDFTASLTFELYKRSVSPTTSVDTNDKTAPSETPQTPQESDLSSHFIRARYQNLSLALPACSDKSKHFPDHPEICTFEAFSEVLKAVAITQADWHQQCQVPVEKPPTFGPGDPIAI